MVTWVKILPIPTRKLIPSESKSSCRVIPVRLTTFPVASGCIVRDTFRISPEIDTHE